jgi:hypothetical protein
MKNRLIIATLAGLGFLAAWGIAIVHADLWQAHAQTRVQPPAVPMQPVAVRPGTPATTAVAVAQLEPAAPDPAAGAPAPNGGGDIDSGPAPTYEEQAAAHDLAAAHSARSR